MATVGFTILLVEPPCDANVYLANGEGCGRDQPIITGEAHILAVHSLFVEKGKKPAINNVTAV